MGLILGVTVLPCFSTRAAFRLDWEYLQNYVNEYAFRYNRRHVPSPMFPAFLERDEKLSDQPALEHVQIQYQIAADFVEVSSGFSPYIVSYSSMILPAFSYAFFSAFDLVRSNSL